ncbi:MAG: hypothetical protein WCA81_18615 [Rhizomicrobium sp.]
MRTVDQRVFLTKRYFDVVSDTGAWAIAYDADLSFLGLQLRYRELTGTGIPPSCRTFGVRRKGDPSTTTFPFPGASAVWDGGETDQQLRFENAALRWTLTHLRSRATVTAGSTSPNGLGYGESLVLKHPPWSLGVQELWWGRYLSADTFLTWIVADGPQPIRFGIINGEATTHVEANASGATIANATVSLGDVYTQITFGDALAGRPRLLAQLGRLCGGSDFGIRQSKAIYTACVKTRMRDETGLVLAEHVTLGRSLGRELGKSPA